MMNIGRGVYSSGDECFWYFLQNYAPNYYAQVDVIFFAVVSSRVFHDYLVCKGK